MQTYLVNNSQKPSFGHLYFTKGARAILYKNIKDSNIEAKRLQKSIEYAAKNNKVNVNIGVNDDNKTLFAYLVNNKTNSIIKQHTENFFTRLIEGPVEFVQNTVLKAEKYADKI